MSEIVDEAEIAKRLGRRPGTVHQSWQSRAMPPELKLVDGHPVWEWETVEAWAVETHRLPGRKCPKCGALVPGRNPRAVYCSPACCREEALRRRLWTKYRLDLPNLAAMHKAQKGRCAACGTKSKNLAVDHDHTTGHVRGLLCGDCNLAVSFVHDSPRRAFAIGAYLRRSVVPGLSLLPFEDEAS